VLTMLPRVMVEAVDSAPSNDYGSEEGPEATEYTVTLTCIVITLMLLVKLVERRLPVSFLLLLSTVAKVEEPNLLYIQLHYLHHCVGSIR